MLLPVGGAIGHAPSRHCGVVVAAEDEAVAEQDLQRDSLGEEHLQDQDEKDQNLKNGKRQVEKED